MDIKKTEDSAMPKNEKNILSVSGTPKITNFFTSLPSETNRTKVSAPQKSSTASTQNEVKEKRSLPQRSRARSQDSKSDGNNPVEKPAAQNVTRRSMNIETSASTVDKKPSVSSIPRTALQQRARKSCGSVVSAGAMRTHAVKRVVSNQPVKVKAEPAEVPLPAPAKNLNESVGEDPTLQNMKSKKKRRRVYRGGTYGLFLSKKKQKKKKTTDEMSKKDDETSNAGTENGSGADSDDGNSLMSSEDLSHPPSEKSLIDDENPRPISSPTDQTSEPQDKLTAETLKSTENDVKDPTKETEPSEKIPGIEAEEKVDDQVVEDVVTKEEEDEKDHGEEVASVDADMEDGDCINDRPEVEDENEEEMEDAVEEQEIEKSETKPRIKIKVLKEVAASESDSMEEDGANSSILASILLGSEKNEERSRRGRISRRDRESTDSQSTIATCVKSRQRIKRKFTDDIVDTDIGLLSLSKDNTTLPLKSTPAPKIKQGPSKDILSKEYPVRIQSVAQGGNLTPVEHVLNTQNLPELKSCTCDDELMDAFIAEEDEVLYCQAVDSINEQRFGCSNQVIHPFALRSSWKGQFSIMCDIHIYRMQLHQSCPHCSLFCTQGEFMLCSSVVKDDIVEHHYYHKDCLINNYEGFQSSCLHCGSTSDQEKKEIYTLMDFTQTCTFSQTPKLKIPGLENARASIFSDAEIRRRMIAKETPISSYKIKDTEKVLTTVGLPDGIDKDLLKSEMDKMMNIKVEKVNDVSEKLYAAVKEGAFLKVLRLLAQGCDPNVKYPEHDNEITLHVAAANGHIAVAHLLIQAGAINDTLNERNETPLHMAVKNKHKDMVLYLIQHGSITDFKGDNGESSLHIAAKNGSLDIVEVLLSSRDTHINCLDDGGWTPIVWACEHDHFDVVRYLLKRGADPSIQDLEGNIALHWAAFSGSVEICFSLLDYECEINALNNSGDTPLHIAARQENFSIVTLFLSRNADTTIKNKANFIPAECCINKTGDTYLSINFHMVLKKVTGKYTHKAEKILHKDITRGKEQIPIMVVNDIDDEPPPEDFLYLKDNCQTKALNIDHSISNLHSCNCEDDCSSSSCSCNGMSSASVYDKEGLLVPEFNLIDPPFVFECNRACNCWSVNCRNRVVQNGIMCRLQLIRTKNKGWGVRTLKEIPKGTFVCEYVGEIISDSDADARKDDSYLFDLDNRDGDTYCLDARYYGNISRFINHHCEPNLMPVKFYVEHQDINFPRIALFSNRDIAQYEELGFDYCEKFWIIKHKYFLCDCSSPNCKYNETTIFMTLANYHQRIRDAEENLQAVDDVPVKIEEVVEKKEEPKADDSKMDES